MLRRIVTSALLAAADLARNSIAIALLLFAPPLLFGIVFITTGERDIAFQLSTAGPATLGGSERQLSLLFIGLTAISGVSAFLALLLVLGPVTTDRRLVFEGYHPGELLLGKLLVLAAIAITVAAWVSVLLPLFTHTTRTAGVLLGFLLASLLYATIGLAIGALARREVEGMLVILLLINIDAGWLQNPVFYAHAHQQQLIRLLPAHFPGQVVMVSAFTTAGIGRAVAASAAWIAAAAMLAAVLYALRVRVLR
jgi:hypothetical protein